MTDVTILLEDATKPQLLEFAQISLGLEVGNFAKKDEILAIIKQAWHKDSITVTGWIGIEDDPPPPEAYTTLTQEMDEEAKTPADFGEHDDAPPAKQDPSKNPDDPKHRANQMITIRIDTVDEPGGSDPVWVSCNGSGMWIPRGKDVQIKQKYVHILQNAVKTVYDQETDDAGNPTGQLIGREVNSYPWRTLTPVIQPAA